MKKRLLHIVLVLILLTSLMLPADAASKEEFTGTRSIQVTADWSDLENYINGGRTAFDQILRGSMPEWFAYEIHTQVRDVTCTFSFSFTSFEDYQKKLKQLIMRTPAILYSREDSLLLMESCTSFDLLNFLEAALNEKKCLSEKSLEEIFRLTGSTIEIHSQSYDAINGVCIRPEDSEAVLMDNLSVKTVTNKNYGFSRTITAQVKSGGDADELEKQFSLVGNAKVRKNEDSYEVSVSFNAASQADLVSKTMQCLNSPTFISETQTAYDHKMVTVERTEFFDIDHLLGDNGSFSYTYVYPSYCENVISEDGSAHIHDSSVTSEGESFIAYTYQRKLQFSSLEIYTDLSAPSGKITRTVICKVPLEIAEVFHRNVTDKLRLNLVNGSVMDISDEGDSRCYKITFSSFLHKEIEVFTASILDDPGYKFDSSLSKLPFAENKIQDIFRVDSPISQIVPADEIAVTYILPDSARVKEGIDADVSTDGSVVTFHIRSKDNISLSYRHMNIIGLTGPAVVICLTAFLIAMIVNRIRRRSRKGGSGTASPVTSHQVRFCGNCGSRLAPDGQFCQECGAKIQR